MSTVEFTPTTTDFVYVENQNININIQYTLILTDEELLEEIPNEISSKTITIIPLSANVTTTELANGFNITGSFDLNDFSAQIFYVDKDKSDRTQTPVVINKYSLVPDYKDIFRIIPEETEKNFVVTVMLTDINDVIYTTTYNIKINIQNNSISNWVTTYFEERY